MKYIIIYCILFASVSRRSTTDIKLCPRKAQTCALLLCCNRDDLEINPMTLKLEIF